MKDHKILSFHKSYWLHFFILLTSFLGIHSPCTGQSQPELLLTAEHSLAAGDTVRAVEEFRQVLVKHPQSFAAAMRLAEVFFDQANDYMAIQYCNIALDITENFEESVSSGSNSAQAHQKIQRYRHDRADIYRLKGTIRARQKQYGKAVEEFKRSLELVYKQETITELALTYLEMGLIHDAISLLHQVRKMDSMGFQPYFNLGNAFFKIQERDSALYYYNLSITKDPTFKWPYLYKGMIYTTDEQYKDAVKQYTQFIQLDTTNEEVYFRRAVLRSELGKWDQAIQDWNKVISINPENGDAWRNQGLSHFRKDDYEAAISAFNQALKIHPEESYTYINRGYSKYLNGNPKEALKDLNIGLSNLPKYYLGFYFRALVNLQLKNKTKACLDVQKAIELGMNEQEIDPKLVKKCL